MASQDFFDRFERTLSNISATSDPITWGGGSGSFTVHATWGGGTVKLQFRAADNSTWIDVGTDTTLTADGGGNFELPPCLLRVNVETATAVYAFIGSHK